MTTTIARPHAEPATTGPGTSRPRRPRSPVAVGVACLVAALVGIALAFFIERETVGNNRATSGDLDPVSDSFLPLDFGNEPTPIFEGRLADLREIRIADVGAGMTNGYRVDLWLADDGTAQPQNQTSTWDLVLTTRTLPPGSTATTTLVPPLQSV